MLTKTHISWGQGSTLHAIGAVFPQLGVCRNQDVGSHSQGASPLFILFDSDNGSLRAVIEAFRLRTITYRRNFWCRNRTPLAREDADEFVLSSARVNKR